MNIWVPKIKIIENTREAIELPGGRLEGFYDITIKHPNGLDEHRSFPNLITDFGLDLWAEESPIQVCYIGNGAAIPSNGVAVISGLITNTESTVSGIQAGKVIEDPFNGFVSVTWNFGTNTTGSVINFTNVGVGVNRPGDNLWSHAQVLDSGGSPDSQSWPAGTILHIAYRCNIYPWLSDSSYNNVSIGSNTYSGVIRPSLINDPLNGLFRLGLQRLGTYGDIPSAYVHTGDIGSMSGSPSGTRTVSADGGTGAYVPGSHELAGWANWSVDQANGNINAVAVYPTTFWYQFSIVPTLVKQVDWFLSLNLRSGTWGRL